MRSREEANVTDEKQLGVPSKITLIALDKRKQCSGDHRIDSGSAWEFCVG